MALCEKLDYLCSEIGLAHGRFARRKAFSSGLVLIRSAAVELRHINFLLWLHHDVGQQDLIADWLSRCAKELRPAAGLRVVQSQL
jgi:hypothetical protein